MVRQIIVGDVLSGRSVVLFCILTPLAAVILLDLLYPSRESTMRRVVTNRCEDGVLLAPDLPTLDSFVATRAVCPGTVIAIPNGTKGRALDTKFLRGGRLVDPYPANEMIMERDHAVRVELFEVTEGSYRGSKGWVEAQFLRPDFKAL